MSRTKWIQFVLGFVIGLLVLNFLPANNGEKCTKLAAIAGGCNE